MSSRSIEKINNNWKFYRGDEPKAWYRGLDDSAWRTVTIPHDWSVEEPFSTEHSSGTGYLPGGQGWYRKNFVLPEEWKGGRVRITFEGVYNNAQVWCNSYYLGKRPYGYSTFSYDITDFIQFGEVGNMISVKVDHKDIADSRWFTGSGIYRDVLLTITDPLHVDEYGVFVTTPKVSKEEAQVSVKVQTTNHRENAVKFQIRNTVVGPDGQAVGVSCSEVQAEADTVANVEQLIQIQNPLLWSPETPVLYAVHTEVLENGRVIDEVTTQTGIRTVSFDAKQGFFLNGENRKIKGVCVHHDAGCLGAAVTDKVWTRRLQALKEMGCNAVRMSHNPPSPGLLDLCDAMGFLVMDEAFDEWEGVKNKWSTGHNVYPPKHFGYYEEFPQWGETDIKDMVRRDRNHPSIIIWSIGNEVDYPNDPYCHSSFQNMTGNNDANKPAAERQYDPNKPSAERLAVIAKKLVHYVKECDTSRPVTSALAFPELSNLTGYADVLDIVGYNYKEHLYEADCAMYQDRVIYGSENSYSHEAWRAVRDNDHICGQFIWTGIDYLGEAHGWPIRVAQPGFLDVAGFKKPRYHYRKSLWNQEPMAYLSARSKQAAAYGDWCKWDLSEPKWNWNNEEKLEVICYTNCEEAELFLNETSLGVKRLADFPLEYLSWDVDFAPGVLKVVTKGIAGSTMESKLETTNEANRIALKTDASELLANGQDLVHVEIQLVDNQGRPVCHDDREITVTVEGAGELIGLENGNGQDLTPYSASFRNTFGGKLIAYVRAAQTIGEIRVKAESKGLEVTQVGIIVK